jgi:uncharacterized membrane protein
MSSPRELGQTPGAPLTAARSETRRDALAVLALLAGASLVCIALVFARIAYSDTSQYRFMLWNLLLAWVPLLLAATIYRLTSREGGVSWALLAPAGLVWLLFFPNAPYLLTDFLHFLEPRNGVPAWYDLLLFSWFAWTGFLLGVTALVPVQAAISRSWGRAAGWAAVVVVIVLTSLGVYVGRFLHWNSWDVITSPGATIERITDGVGRPLKLFAFTVLFSALFLLVYAASRAVSRLAHDASRRPH